MTALAVGDVTATILCLTVFCEGEADTAGEYSDDVAASTAFGGEQPAVKHRIAKPVIAKDPRIQLSIDNASDIFILVDQTDLRLRQVKPWWRRALEPKNSN
ncbi:MAG: hypothetical protein ABL956_01635 [Hyphomonadaceae bacterium]